MPKTIQDIEDEIAELGQLREALDEAHLEKLARADAVTAAQDAYSKALTAEGEAKTALEALDAVIVADVNEFATAPSPDPVPPPVSTTVTTSSTPKP